ncbi:MAG: hypothetical protein ABIK92_21695 [Pseudomonadota bacterium]
MDDDYISKILNGAWQLAKNLIIGLFVLAVLAMSTCLVIHYW